MTGPAPITTDTIPSAERGVTAPQGHRLSDRVGHARSVRLRAAAAPLPTATPSRFSPSQLALVFERADRFAKNWLSAERRRNQGATDLTYQRAIFDLRAALRAAARDQRMLAAKAVTIIAADVARKAGAL